MKTLLVIRHAKSSWDSSVLFDFDRPLNERGKKDAPVMANRIIKRGIGIDVFISSPAMRAKNTAEIFCVENGMGLNAVVLVKRLYQAEIPAFVKTVKELDETLSTVAIFAHNPGITEFINLLLPDDAIGNMPTCGVFAIKIDIAKWTDFSTGNKELLFFDYPKLLS